MESTIDRRQVRQHFSCHAREYDRYANVQQKVASRLLELLISQDGNWTRALEVGCGTGLLSRRVVRKYPDLPIVLSDLAHGMSVATSEFLPGRHICDADAASLPFRDGAFDLLISSSVYQWLDDLPEAFNEVARVLQPGGLFALSLFGEKTLHELRASHRQALPEKPSHGQDFFSRDKVIHALGESFTPLFDSSEFEIEWHASVADLLRNLKRIGAQNASHKRPSGLASRLVMQQMMSHYQQDFGSAREFRRPMRPSTCWLDAVDK